MSKVKTKEEIINHKNTAINDFSLFMDSLIESSNPNDIKRANLISYWIKDFQQYILLEKSFDASKIKSYKRGDVIKVNLGFNVGSEQGGLRYAIVLDKDNKHNAKTITVIPLTSQKNNKEVNERDVPLGRELYNRLKSKYDSIKDSIKPQHIKYEQALHHAQVLKDFMQKQSPIAPQPLTETAEDLNWIDGLISFYNESLKELDEKKQSLAKIDTELHKMRYGSIAKIEQITTISKQRIYDPKKSADVLAGIRFSDAAMDKINEKIKELYIF